MDELVEAQKSSWLGFVAAAVSILFFGINFIPVKQFETGDGFFFQWVLCCGIWHVGLIVNLIQNFPQFHPLAMLGGSLWATGNLTVVPIIKTIGLGLGFLIWGAFNLLAGWASGRFGWFGLKQEIPTHPALNYVGVSLAVFSVLLFVFVKSEINPEQVLHVQSDSTPLLEGDIHLQSLQNNQSQTVLDRLTPFSKRILGISLAAFAGILYGVNFAPVIYIKDNVESASQNDLDYEFAHFCGIFMTSTVYLIIYSAYMRNNPHIYPKIIIPGLISGIMWGIAMTGWFIANREMTEAVSFPIVTTGPGLIAAFVGVIIFKEIKGIKNYIFMGLAFLFSISGAVLSGLSK